VEKDMTDMLQNSDDAGEHANDATPQVSKEPKDARGAHRAGKGDRRQLCRCPPLPLPVG